VSYNLGQLIICLETWLRTHTKKNQQNKHCTLKNNCPCWEKDMFLRISLQPQIINFWNLACLVGNLLVHLCLSNTKNNIKSWIYNCLPKVVKITVDPLGVKPRGFKVCVTLFGRIQKQFFTSNLIILHSMQLVFLKRFLHIILIV
jgi:hypothetical protein